METPLPTIPSQPQQPKQGVPVPETKAPPVPTVEQIQAKASPYTKTPLQQRAPTLLETLGRALFPATGKPGLFMERAPLPGQSFSVPFLQESGALPSQFFGFGDPTSGRATRGRDIFGAEEGRKRSHRTIASFLSRGIRPPFISFNAQKFLGISSAEFEAMGYQFTPAGWVRRAISSAVEDYVGGGGGGEHVNRRLGGVGTRGGGSVGRRLSQTGLVNWRI